MESRRISPFDITGKEEGGKRLRSVTLNLLSALASSERGGGEMNHPP